MLAIFCGNDYLPPIRTRTTCMDNLWKSYLQCLSELKSSLIEEDWSLNLKFLKKLISLTYKNKKKKDTLQIEGISPEFYLQGCLWNVSMYVFGRCQDYSFFCDNTKHGPKPSEMLQWISSNINKKLFVKCNPKDTFPLTPCKTLMALLPPEGERLIPKEFQPVFKKINNKSNNSSTPDIASVIKTVELINDIPSNLLSPIEIEHLSFHPPILCKAKGRYTKYTVKERFAFEASEKLFHRGIRILNNIDCFLIERRRTNLRNLPKVITQGEKRKGNNMVQEISKKQKKGFFSNKRKRNTENENEIPKIHIDNDLQNNVNLYPKKKRRR